MKVSLFGKGILGLFLIANINGEVYGSESLQNAGGNFAEDAEKIHMRGIDVSHFQGNINWGLVAGDEIYFAITKATGGETYVDPLFDVNWHGMRTNEITRGAYHFFYASDDPIKQAQHYLNVVGTFKEKDLPPIVDVEITDNVSAQDLFPRLVTWLQTVEKATGRTPMIYTDVAFGVEFLKHQCLQLYPLWLADYSNSIQQIPSPWSKVGWTIWQHSSVGNVSGIEGNVDLDIFNGDKKQFSEFLTRGVRTDHHINCSDIRIDKASRLNSVDNN